MVRIVSATHCSSKYHATPNTKSWSMQSWSHLEDALEAKDSNQMEQEPHSVHFAVNNLQSNGRRDDDGSKRRDSHGLDHQNVHSPQSRHVPGREAQSAFHRTPSSDSMFCLHRFRKTLESLQSHLVDSKGSTDSSLAPWGRPRARPGGHGRGKGMETRMKIDA